MLTVAVATLSVRLLTTTVAVATHSVHVLKIAVAAATFSVNMLIVIWSKKRRPMLVNISLKFHEDVLKDCSYSV